jgi:hypothetical protein
MTTKAAIAVRETVAADHCPASGSASFVRRFDRRPFAIVPLILPKAAVRLCSFGIWMELADTAPATGLHRARL